MSAPCLLRLPAAALALATRLHGQASARFGAVAAGIGTQLIIPTGTDDSFSGNRWRLIPTAGVRVPPRLP